MEKSSSIPFHSIVCPGCDVTTIADKARTKIIVFYDRSINNGYAAQTLPNQSGGLEPPNPPPPLAYAFGPNS